MKFRESVMDSIRQLNNTIQKQQGRMSPNSNGNGHGRLLKCIAENQGMSAKELAMMLEISPAAISVKLKKLEKDGMIRRDRDEKDVRVIHLYLTADGRMALERRAHGERRFGEAVEDALSEEEQIQFCSMCDRLRMAFMNMEVTDRKRKDNLIDFYTEQQKARHKKAEDVSGGQGE